MDLFLLIDVAPGPLVGGLIVFVIAILSVAVFSYPRIRVSAQVAYTAQN